jgi:PAS domain-containing protein
MASLENLTQLLLTSLDDVARLVSLLDTTMQHFPGPAFELSLEGAIWYLNRAASDAIGVPPQQAVGTRLTTYVADSLMTQRRIDALSQRGAPQSWPDAWRRVGDPQPCRLTGFALPRALSPDRPRLIVWSEPPAGHSPDPTVDDRSPPPLIPPDRLLCGQDLDPLRGKLGLGVNRLCDVLGISAVTWYAWRRQPTTPIPSRTTALHLRLLDVLPDLAQLGAHPADLQEALRTHRGMDVTFTELALWMGVERRSGYAWAHGNPASDQVQALTRTLLQLLFEKPREAWEQYRELVAQQAQLEQVDLATTKSWTATGPKASLPPTTSIQDQKPTRRMTRNKPGQSPPSKSTTQEVKHDSSQALPPGKKPR